MDPARYGLQQGWDNNSDLDGYSAVNDPNFRVGGSYDERRLYDERYLRDNIYPRNAFHPDIIDRDNHPPSHPTEMWPHSRRRSYEDEYPIDRESKHHEKQYFDSHHDMDPYHDPKSDNFQDFVKVRDSYRKIDNYRDNELDKHARFGVRDRNDYAYDDYDYRSCFPHPKREDSRETDYDYGQHSYDSDYERSSKRDVNWRRRESRERERDKRCLSRERDSSPYRKWDRSLSRGHVEHSRSRSPRGRSRSRSHREDSYDDGRYERIDRRRDREEKRHPENYSVVPSPTVVVKGLSHKTTEEDLYQILAEWGPLRHVRVIRERNSGISRGFSFIDFPSVGAARAMMEKLGDDGLYIDGRKLFFEYSSKPTGGSSGYLGQEGSTKSGHVNHRSMTVPSDWMCTSCGYVNFARRTSCFQCNEARSEDAPPADISLSSSAPLGKKGSEAGPTYVLVVRGLDENADEDMLRYEFSKHAPIKDLRLVRDKFTHVSRGFAFVHFHSVEDATKALDATNGITLEKNGQILRVAYAKSILGSGSGTSGFSHANSLAAAAIEAATFSQQYDAVGWAPKEYNPDEKQSMGEQEHSGVETQGQKDSYAPQSGFVWDETSGYYYDAASGFYYDGNTGLYYDSNNGIWYSYDQKSQQYIPCTDQNDNKISRSISEAGKVSDVANSSKVVISAPATTSTLEKMSSLPDAVQAAATAALAAEKKEKEKSKEIKLASKSSIIANKKKMNTVLTMWKQRSHEGQAPRVALDDNQPTASGGERLFSAGKSKTEVMNDNAVSISGVTTVSSAQSVSIESLVNPRPVSNSSGRPLMGVIRGSTRGIVKSENSGVSTSSNSTTSTVVHVETPAVTPFRTDASALGSYTPASTASKRRFSEMPLPPASTPKEQPRTSYRDRAAERRTLYGSSYSINDSSDLGFADSNGDLALRKNSVDSMPFPPGVGGGRPSGDSSLSNYEVITADKAIDETNVGNRMLRSMGWQEGLGLGKDGSGMVEPVQAQAMESRAGLGSRQKKLNAEVQAGDSYKTLIHKKALARFREMS